MTELLKELVKVPLFLNIITVIIIVGCMILAKVADHYDKNHYGKKSLFTSHYHFTMFRRSISCRHENSL